MSTLSNNKENLYRVINEQGFKEQSLPEKCSTLAYVADFVDKYQLRDLRHECALLRYYIAAKNGSVSLLEKCDLILDIAESFINYGYAILSMKIVNCVLALNNGSNDLITAKSHYYNGFAFSSLDNSLFALKEFEKAKNIAIKLNNRLLLSQIYCQMGVAYKSHPLKRQKSKAIEYFKRSIEIKEKELGKPFSIINDYLGYLRCIENEADFNKGYAEYIDFIISNSYEKHFRLSWYYKVKAYQTNGEEANRLFALANDCLLNQFSLNKNITSLTHTCKSIGIDCIVTKKYDLAIMFFEIAEKLYRYWDEQDFCDLFSTYEWLWICYNKINNKQKAKEYLKLAKKQKSIAKYISTSTQFLNITKDSINEYLKTLFVSEIHKRGFGLKTLDEYANELFQRIFEAVDIMEMSQFKTRTFDECCADMLFEAGRSFRNGEYNIESDSEYSDFLFSKAADLGSIPAKFTLMTESEAQPPIDEMVNLVKTAFESGDYEIGIQLGMMTSNMKERAHYYSVAAENGNSVAKYYLGLMYRDGTGVEKNVPEAVKLWEQAAAKNNTNSLTEMGLVHKSNNVLFDLGCEPYDFSFVKKDKKKSFDYFMKAAKLGDARAQFMLGQIYMKDEEHSTKALPTESINGHNEKKFYVQQDLSSAELWLKKSAEQNYALAMLFLAQLYSDKTDSQYFNYQDAIYWFDKTYFTFINSNDEFEQDIAEGAKNQKERFVKQNFWHQGYKPPRWK
jgi:TPR repeat protein